MMNNNHKNSGCGYEERLVSYLYGESSAAESAEFESHLQACRSCGDEFEAFSGVKFSINDWKMNEFAALAAPRIEIPYENSSNNKETVGVQASWWSKLGDLFSLSPAWSLATASLAVLAVGVGIVLFALNYQKDNSIAGQNNNRSNPVTAPTAEKSPEVSNPAANQTITPERAVKPALEVKTPPAQVTEVTETKIKKPANAAIAPRQPQKADLKTAAKPDEPKRSMKNNQQVAPKIVEEEDEDDTLRLAELFEEIGKVE